MSRHWMLGACGMGMGPLALYLRATGHEVRAWDDAPRGPMLDHLRSAGITLDRDPWASGWSPEVVGHSAAIAPGHPLRALAAARGAELVRRGELLARAAAGRRLVAVCGSHGKTTTCGMVIAALDAAGADFGHILGGLFRDPAAPPARAARASDWLVAEVDESDGSIGAFSPEVTVAVNLDWDHPDYYRSEADLERVFADLFRRTTSLILIPADSPRLRRLAEGCAARVLTVGPGGDLALDGASAGPGRSRATLSGLWPRARLELPVEGAFNRANAGLALAVAWHVAGHLGERPLGDWAGIRRRQDTLLDQPGLRVVADYAHHPTEIAALLGLLRETAPGRLAVVFQPHRHTRTRQYAAAFRDALAVADRILLLPVYSAGETPVEGGASSDLLPAADPRFELVADRARLPSLLRRFLADGPATVAFVGAGDVDRDALAFARAEDDLAARLAGQLSPACVLRRAEPLARRVTLGVGGPAAWYAEPASESDASALLRAARRAGLPAFVLGRGSNLLVPDAGYEGLVIHLAADAWTRVEPLGDLRLRVGGGARLKELCGAAARLGLAGLEFLEGIPGTVGGSLRMNAGAMGAWIFDRVESVDWLDADGERRSAPREAFDAGYRDCPQLHGALVLSAVLRAERVDQPEAVRARMAELAARRRASQPREPSAGCVFRNPEGAKAGALIDAAGLKSLSSGGALVSPVHANFIVNPDGASSDDVLALMRRVRSRVRDASGIQLEPEILLLGKEWGEVL